MNTPKTLAALFLINFAVTLGFGMADAFFSVYSQSLGARGLLLGVALGCYACAKIALSPLMGRWSDRIDPKTLLCASLLAYLFVSLGYLIFANLTALVLLRTLQGAGFALFRPVLVSIIGRIAPPDRRAATTGTFDLSFYGALGVGPLLGGVLKDAFGYSGVFCALLGCCLLAFVLALACISATPRSTKAVPLSEPPKPLPLILHEIASRGTLAGLLVFIFGRACSISGFVVFLPILLMTELGISAKLFGLVMASSTAAMALTLRPMGMLADKVSRVWLIAAGGAGAAFLYCLVPLAVSLHEFLLLGTMIGLFGAMSQPASTALLIEQGERCGTGLAAGVFNCSLNAGFLAGPVLGTLIYDMFGIEVVFYCFGACGLFTVFLFLLCASNRNAVQCSTHEKSLNLQNVPLVRQA